MKPVHKQSPSLSFFTKSIYTRKGVSSKHSRPILKSAINLCQPELCLEKSYRLVSLSLPPPENPFLAVTLLLYIAVADTGLQYYQLTTPPSFPPDPDE